MKHDYETTLRPKLVRLVERLSETDAETIAEAMERGADRYQAALKLLVDIVAAHASYRDTVGPEHEKDWLDDTCFAARDWMRDEGYDVPAIRV